MRTLLSKKVGYNKDLKPLGVKKVVHGHHGVECLEVRPAYVSKLDLVPDFVEVCSPYIKPVISVQYPADSIVIVKNARVYSSDVCNMAIISQDNYLLEDISFQWRGDGMLKGQENEIFNRKGFSKPKKFKGKVYSLLAGGAAKHYYYHWVFDAMPKLALLKQSGLYDQVNYFLVPNYEFAYHREFMDHFGIPAEKIINEEVDYHIQVDYLLVCPDVRRQDHHPKWATDFLYNSFQRFYQNKKRDKLIYIGRGDASKNRKVNSEAVLVEELKKYGFEAYLLSHISLVEKASLFNSAKIVVAAHGAGLSNVVFCQPGTKVLEIFPDKYVRHAYYDLCNKRELEYHYMLCESEGTANNTSEGQGLGMVPDIEAIKEKVGRMLA